MADYVLYVFGLVLTVVYVGAIIGNALAARRALLSGEKPVQGPADR